MRTETIPHLLWPGQGIAHFLTWCTCRQHVLPGADVDNEDDRADDDDDDDAYDDAHCYHDCRVYIAVVTKRIIIIIIINYINISKAHNISDQTESEVPAVARFAAVLENLVEKVIFQTAFTSINSRKIVLFLCFVVWCFSIYYFLSVVQQ